MAITTVKATINGQQYTLTKSGSVWTATITAPGATSYNQTGGYYNVSVTATNDAGTSATATADDLDGLKFYVRETVPPVITITSPTDGAYITNSSQAVVGTVVDEANGSGVDPDSIVVKLDGAPISNIQTSKITNGYQFTATTTYSEGPHTVTVDAADNDGNSATQKSISFTVDTVPPTLSITSPADGLITNSNTVNVIGTTNDATSSPVSITISVNGTDQGTATVGGDGGFSKSVTISEGENTIIVTATDVAGKTSSVTRTVTLDTSVPQITAATISPNPADTGASVVITVTIV